jgi:hypothetical protein
MFRPGALHFHHDGRFAVHCSADHLIALALLYRPALSGEQGLIHRRAPFENHAVGRNLLSRFYDDLIPGGECAHGDVLHCPVGATPVLMVNKSLKT